MAVTVKTTRKAVEIAWNVEGAPTEPPVEEKPPGFPTHPIFLPGEPTHPIYLPPYIDNSLPGEQPGIDNTLPEPEQPVDPDYGVDEGAHPDNTLPGDQPRPDNTLPGDQPVINPLHDTAIGVQVFAQGMDGDWSNGPVMKNDGLAVLTYPKDFTGESYVEVRALDGSLVDSGSITVK